MDIKLDASDFAQLADYWQRAPEVTRSELLRAVTEVDLELQATLKEELPRGAGGAAGLAGSIATEETALADNVIGMVYTQQAYAGYVELGTQPHAVNEAGIQSIADWVQAKFGEHDEAQALGIAHAIAWKIRRHGTKANPVWSRTWDAALPRIRERFDGAMRRINNRLASA